jgi:hypothetical protein
MKNNIKYSLLLMMFLLSIMLGSFVLAEIDANKYFFIHLDHPTIEKGYTVTAFDDEIKLSLVPGILSEDTGVDVVQINESMESPWNLDMVSDIYQFEFRNKTAYDNHKPYYIQFSYEESGNGLKQVYFYDKNFSTWRPLPTVDYPGENFVRSLIHLPFARIVVFENTDYMSVGKASWYGYKGGNFAASPDFPKGSILRVTNIDNNKFIDVEINDYGPDRSLHLDRVIDLDKIAFGKIASLGAGIIDVKVEPIKINPDNDGEVLGMKESGASYEPDITSKAFALYDEKNGNMLWENNSNMKLPLASLTKILAIYTYLNINTDLDKVVTYSTDDEEYNYKYCAKWESARVKLSDGDQVTAGDLIYSSLVGSANNAVETLVRASGISRESFVGNMNSFAKKWGTTNTYFEEPTGLSPKNVSSPSDYVIITKEVFKNELIKKVSTTSKYDFTTLNTKEEHRIRNTNKLININNGYIITGTKTGYLNEAGHCLMVRAENNEGEQVVAVIFNANTRDVSVSEIDTLVDYGFRLIDN